MNKNTGNERSPKKKNEEKGYALNSIQSPAVGGTNENNDEIQQRGRVSV
jgi:hypothetical protein